MNCWRHVGERHDEKKERKAKRCHVALELHLKCQKDAAPDGSRRPNKWQSRGIYDHEKRSDRDELSEMKDAETIVFFVVAYSAHISNGYLQLFEAKVNAEN